LAFSPLISRGTEGSNPSSGESSANLTRGHFISAPADPVPPREPLVRGEGPQPVTFIAVWKPDLVGSDIDPRGMAAFSGSAPPIVAGGPGFCGTYNYEAGR
jgi:hypothetical protein